MTATMTPELLEVVQRTMLIEAARDARHAADTLDDLAIAAPWDPHSVKCSDTKGAVRLLRQSLDALDALGWPADEVS